MNSSDMTTAIPARLRLDNAANIYPASMSKHYSSLYRMSVCFKEEVDKKLLGEALLSVSERIPTFRCRLRAGAFWWYLERSSTLPSVLPLKPLKLFSYANQGGLLYRVSANGSTLSLDVFHALTDGFGAMSFLLTLSGEYLRLRYGIHIHYSPLVLDPRESPSYSEVEDSFKTVFTGRKGKLEKNVDAYHIKGRTLSSSGLKDVRAVMPIEDIKAVCKSYDCTVTDLLTAVMVSALQEEYRKDKSAKKSSVLKVSVPVNLRPLYNSRSLRNFSSYVNLGVDAGKRYLSFFEILREVKEQKKHDLSCEDFESKIAANVELEEMLLVRLLPLVIKHPIIDYINLHHGDRFCSQTLSNMGNIELPEEMKQHIKDIDFVLGRQRGNSGAASCVGFGGNLYFHMTRKIEESSFETTVLSRLKILGIRVNTTSATLA